MGARLSQSVFILALLFSCHSLLGAIDPKACIEAYVAVAGDTRSPQESVPRVLADQGSPEMQAFYKNVLLPAVGMRALKSSPEIHRTCEVDGSCMILGNFGADFDLRVRFDEHAAEPRITWEDSDRTLVLPKGYDFGVLSDNGRSLIRRFLIGHPLHPYIYSQSARAERESLGEDPLLLKEVQVEGREAAVEAVEAGDPSFLFVAPTGTGKTEVAKGVLETQLSKNIQLDAAKNPNARRLQFVVAHENFLVDQLQGDVMDLVHSMKASGKYPGTDFVIVRWGEDQTNPLSHTETISHNLSMEGVLDLAMTEGKQVILVSTIQSLQSKTGSPSGETSEFVRENLGGIVFDEAHHAGAPDTLPYLNFWLDRAQGSRAFLYGTTATPTHHEVDLINHLFQGRAYWAYLDTPESFRQGGTPIERPVGEVVTQLEEAIHEGELTPFHTHFIDPDRMSQRLTERLGNRATDDTNTSLFIDKLTLLPEEARSLPTEDPFGSRRILNPLHYRNVISMFEPLFLEHQRGFIATASRDEAEAFTAALTDYFKDAKGRKPTFAYLHSYMNPADKRRVKEDFKAGRIDFLVTIRMMDEGVNVPDLTLFIDITEHTAPRQLLQRIGRILRVYPGKQDPVDVVSFQSINDVEIADMLNRLNGLGSSAPPKKPRERDPGEPVPIDWESAWRDQHGIVWTTESIRRHLQEFFINPDRGSGAAAKDLALLRAAYLDPERPLENLAVHGRSKVTSGEHTSYVRTVINNLIRRTDSRSKNAPGNRAFEAHLVLAEEGLRDWVKAFRKDRARKHELMKTDEGTAQLIIEEAAHKHGGLRFRSQYVLNEAENTLNDDQKRLYQHLLNSRTNIGVILAAEKHPDLSEGAASYLLEPVATHLTKPAMVGMWAADFYKQFGRLPNPEAEGVEGQLAKALDGISEEELPAVVKNEEATLAILEEREAHQRAAKTTAERTRKEKARADQPPLPVGENAPPHLKDKNVRDRMLAVADQHLTALGRQRSLNAALQQYLVNLQTTRQNLQRYEDAVQFHKEVDPNDLDLLIEAEREIREAAALLTTRITLETLLADPAELAQVTSTEKIENVTLVFSGPTWAVNNMIDLYAAPGVKGLKSTQPEIRGETRRESTISVKFTGPKSLVEALRAETNVRHNAIRMENGKPYSTAVRVSEDGKAMGETTTSRSYNFGSTTVVSGMKGGSVTLDEDPQTFFDIFSGKPPEPELDELMDRLVTELGT